MNQRIRRRCVLIVSPFNFQEDQTTIEVDIDPRVHRRLIGARGASIHRVMDQFKVDIRFPRSDNPNGPVAISGAPDNVDDAKDHLLILEEEYVSTFGTVLTYTAL